MKQIIGLFIVALSGVMPASAQSMLKVSLTDRSPITVSVDGRYFKKTGESVTVGDLPPGRHYLEIFVSTSSAHTARARVWEGRVKTHNGTLTVFSLNPYNHEAVSDDEEMPDMSRRNEAERYNNHNLNNYDTRDDQPNRNADNNMPGNSMTNNNQPAEPVIADNTPDSLAPGTPLASPVTIDEPVEKPTPKKAVKSDKLKKLVDAKNTDTDKLETVKNALKNDKLTTTRVMSVMDWFNFENTKVEFAKWAYAKTTDKANFRNVKQKLTLKNYREEMDKFLRDNK